MSYVDSIKRKLGIAIALLVLLFVSGSFAGCASRTATPLAAADLTSDTIYYVENHGKDKRGLDQIIANELQSYGLNASSGGLRGVPENTTRPG